MKVETISSYLSDAMKKAKDGGEIWLDILEGKFKHLPHNEVVRQVREVNAANAKFVIGRRGAKSRFVWGNKLVATPVTAPKGTAPVARIPRQTRQTRQVQPAIQQMGGGFSLKFKIGDNQIAEIPVNLELSAA